MSVTVSFTVTPCRCKSSICGKDGPHIIRASLSEPYIDELNIRNPYIIIIFVWYFCPPRAAIDITLARAIYSNWPHKDIYAMHSTATYFS